MSACERCWRESQGYGDPVDPRYEAWIKSYRDRVGITHGRCKPAVAEMREAFPELREVRGHVFSMTWARRGHIWCETPDGEIVDPTADQFPDIVRYEPWKPGDEVLVGKCMNCGEEIWRAVWSLTEEPVRVSTCSEDCDRELMAEFNYERA